MVKWKAKRTLLIVGEGADEVAFLKHVKQLYVERGCGLAVTIKNAQGKGAKHVVEWTIKQAAIADYDAVAVLLDTDTDWSASVRKQAERKKIHLLLSEPCFEALLLRTLGQHPVEVTAALKSQFAPFVGHDATNSQNYSEHFCKETLESCRIREITIDSLLKLLVC